MAKRVGGRGSAPDLAGGAYDAPRPPSRLGRAHPSPDPTPLSAFGASILAPSGLRGSILAFLLLLIYEMTTAVALPQIYTFLRPCSSVRPFVSPSHLCQLTGIGDQNERPSYTCGPVRVRGDLSLGQRTAGSVRPRAGLRCRADSCLLPPRTARQLASVALRQRIS